jgi:hypothetical protein
MKIDLAHPLRVFNEEGLLVKKLLGMARLYVPLSKARVSLFDEEET